MSCTAFDLSLRDDPCTGTDNCLARRNVSGSYLVMRSLSTIAHNSASQRRLGKCESSEHVYDYLNQLNGYARNAGVQFEKGGRDSKEHVNRFLETCGDLGLERRLCHLRVKAIHELDDIINDILKSEEQGATRETSPYLSRGRDRSHSRDERHQLEDVFYLNDLAAFMKKDPVMKIVRPKLIGSALIGPVTIPPTMNNKLDAQNHVVPAEGSGVCSKSLRRPRIIRSGAEDDRRIHAKPIQQAGAPVRAIRKMEDSSEAEQESSGSETEDRVRHVYVAVANASKASSNAHQVGRIWNGRQIAKLLHEPRSDAATVDPRSPTTWDAGRY
ncbi:unnamed protein product [Phytophthora fragariaefolia]|uniref:Unnamed protein product n=1 Tax=Phytophthora fragariaefolia TaxID=1490495 RepID=A0A9W6TYI5_9STRA|nr:unnamed protein product [Phytophthora fragariaefolia]